MLHSCSSWFRIPAFGPRNLCLSCVHKWTVPSQILFEFTCRTTWPLLFIGSWLSEPLSFLLACFIHQYDSEIHGYSTIKARLHTFNKGSSSVCNCWATTFQYVRMALRHSWPQWLTIQGRILSRKTCVSTGVSLPSTIDLHDYSKRTFRL